MKFKTVEIDPDFKPIALAVIVESYEDLHRLANGIGVTTSEVIKGLREQAHKELLKQQKIGKCGAWCPGCAECGTAAEKAAGYDRSQHVKTTGYREKF